MNIYETIYFFNQWLAYFFHIKWLMSKQMVITEPSMRHDTAVVQSYLVKPTSSAIIMAVMLRIPFWQINTTSSSSSGILTPYTASNWSGCISRTGRSSFTAAGHSEINTHLTASGFTHVFCNKPLVGSVCDHSRSDSGTFVVNLYAPVRWQYLWGLLLIQLHIIIKT